MSVKDRVERLNKNGYTTIHLFGDWYFCRVYSKNHFKISPWWFYKIVEPPVIVDDEIVKPTGEYRIK